MTLMCQPEAAPEATKQWFKDGSEFTGSTNVGDRVVLLPNGNIHITGVEQSDAGNYTCVATNIYGSDSTSGNLTIKRKLILMPTRVFVCLFVLKSCDEWVTPVTLTFVIQRGGLVMLEQPSLNI